METYSLAREDIDSMSELVSLPGKPDLFSKVESKVKSIGYYWWLVMTLCG